MPFGKALEILLLAKYVEAQEAVSIGLAQAIVEPDKVVEKAFEWARTIAGFSPAAVRETKKLAYAAMPMGWEESFALGAEVMQKSFQSEDGREGFTAFLEKRSAKFGEA